MDHKAKKTVPLVFVSLGGMSSFATQQMRALNNRDSQAIRNSTARKAAGLSRPASALSGVTLWGTTVTDTPASAAPAVTRRSNHYQNCETLQTNVGPCQPSPARNHLQNSETVQQPCRLKMKASQINDSHFRSHAPVVDGSTRRELQSSTASRPTSGHSSRINDGHIVFGAYDTPKRPPPPRVEPLSETPRRGHVRSTLPGFTDAYKFPTQKE